MESAAELDLIERVAARRGHRAPVAIRVNPTHQLGEAGWIVGTKVEAGLTGGLPIPPGLADLLR